MVIALAFGILLVLLVVRELVRAILHGTLRRSAIYELVTPVSPPRRVLAIAGGLVATVACVIAIAYVSFGVYGAPSGEARYKVAEVIAGGAAEGILKAGDRIDTFDGGFLRVGRGPGLVERVQAKDGEPVQLGILRDGVFQKVEVTPRQGTNNSGEKLWLLGIRPAGDPIFATKDAVGRALRYPLQRVANVPHDIAWLVGSDQVEVGDVGSVVRITTEFHELDMPLGAQAFLLALVLAGTLMMVLALLDLVRLALVIRDRLAAR